MWIVADPHIFSPFLLQFLHYIIALCCVCNICCIFLLSFCYFFHLHSSSITGNIHCSWRCSTCWILDTCLEMALKFQYLVWIYVLYLSIQHINPELNILTAIRELHCSCCNCFQFLNKARVNMPGLNVSAR